MQNQQESPGKPDSAATLKAFLTGAVLAASALVGGLTVVLLNRKVLFGLRQQAESAKTPPAETDAEES